jgi:hypothetical protein
MPRHADSDGEGIAEFVYVFFKITLPRRFWAGRTSNTSWANTAALIESNLNLKLPHHRKQGCCFRIDPADRSFSAVELEAFTRALAKHLAETGQATDRSFDLAEVWRVARATGPAAVSIDATA